MVLGVATNLARLRSIVEHPAFLAGELHTGFLDEHLGELTPRACPPPEALAAVAAWPSPGPDGPRARGRSLSRDPGPLDPASGRGVSGEGA